MRRFAAALLSALILSACPVHGETLLVGNKGEDTLSIIALDSGAELARVGTGRMPHEIAVSPDGRRAAVVAYGGASIDIIDLKSRTRVETIDISPNRRPHGLLFHRIAQCDTDISGSQPEAGLARMFAQVLDECRQRPAVLPRPQLFTAQCLPACDQRFEKIGQSKLAVPATRD